MDKAREKIKGRVSKELISEAINDPAHTAVFACGPDNLNIPKNMIRKESYI